MQLEETEQKLEEAEQQCEDLTKSVFAACQPCLEETRKAFYTSKCRRGFTLFSFKVEELFRKSATLRHVYNHEVAYFISQREAVTEIEEMNMLLKASCQLLLVQGHTEDTQRWLSNMADQYEWISWLFSGRRSSRDIFSMITAMSPQQTNGGLGPDRNVTVTLLDSAPIRVWVPAELQLKDPAFIRQVVQEALTHFKRKTSGSDTPS